MTGDYNTEERVAHALATIPARVDPLDVEAVLSAYRRSRAGKSASRRIGRALAPLLVASLTMGGGVAAAYAASLPSPVQRAAHRMLSVLGVPAPRRHITSPHSARHSDPVRAPLSTNVASRELQLRPDRTTVPAGRVVTLTAMSPDTRQGDVVLLLVRVGTTFRAVSQARIGPDHRAVFRVHIQSSTGFVAVPATRPGERSRLVSILAMPQLEVQAVTAAKRWGIDIHVTGARPGEVLRLFRETRSGRRLVATCHLGPDSRAWIWLPLPNAASRYVVLLRGTALHGPASVSVRVR